MADVLEFRRPANDDGGEDVPHLSGEAFCGVCDHEWMAVAPVGVTHLECPKCRRFWGAYKHVVEPETQWTCKCGAMCRRCGVRSNDWADVS